MAPLTKRRATRLGLVLCLVAGCSPIPSLEFVSDGSTDGGSSPSTIDATLPGADGAANEDAAEDSGAVDMSSDDGGASDAAIECGSTMVASCTQCPGLPLHCTKGMRNACIADCNDCAADWFPCFHCATPDAAPRGSCVPVGADGTLACTTSNLCGCATPEDCPTSPGAAQTCAMTAKGIGRCLTCGAPTTADAGCASASGSSGVCVVADGASPVCR